MGEDREAKEEVNLDEKYNLRPLKRGEIKRFKAKGFFLKSIDKLDSDKQDEFIDMVNEAVIGDLDDDLTVAEGLKVFLRIVELTYGDEEKNFSMPGAGTRAAGRKSAKTAKKTRHKTGG